MKVDVYRNLRNGMWSVRHKGRVIMRVAQLELHDVEFKVSQAGRARAVREKRRNVHAVARGVLASIDGVSPSNLTTHVTYNPFKFSTFVDAATQAPVLKSPAVFFGQNGQVLASA